MDLHIFTENFTKNFFQVNWEINHRGSSSVAFLRCVGQEETFRWVQAFLHLESISLWKNGFGEFCHMGKILISFFCNPGSTWKTSLTH